jgi:hypothetical protein
MNFGFNSNVRVGNTTYHVQTEDRGPSHPYLDTVVYVGGRVVYKRSTSYKEFAASATPETLPQKLHERLSHQHQQVIGAIEAGTLSLNPGKKHTSAAAVPNSSDGLELRLMNPKGWLASGKATLEIELWDRNEKRRLANVGVQAISEVRKRRVLCAEGVTDAEGRVTLQFPMPSNVGDSSCLLVRAVDDDRHTELRFQLKAKGRHKAPAPVSR